jgi:hypothetical protein
MKTMQKRIVKALRITSIAAVDRPAQKNATARIMKSHSEDKSMKFKKSDILKAAIEKMAEVKSPGENKFIAMAKLLETQEGRRVYDDLRTAQNFPDAA